MCSAWIGRIAQLLETSSVFVNPWYTTTICQAEKRNLAGFHLLASISSTKDIATAMNDVYKTLPVRVATTARMSSSNVGPVD